MGKHKKQSRNPRSVKPQNLDPSERCVRCHLSLNYGRDEDTCTCGPIDHSGEIAISRGKLMNEILLDDVLCECSMYNYICTRADQ